MSDWDSEEGFRTWHAGVMDTYLGKPRTSVRSLVSGSSTVPPEPPSGTRVAFDGNLSSIVAYPNPPTGASLGTIVSVRTAMGDSTNQDGMVFVKWDDGAFQAVHHSHLLFATTAGGDKQAAARVSEYRRPVASVGDLGEFLRVASDSNDLVHKATKDLWNLKKTDGGFVIERLFNETGDPLKV